jgi:hypothetical protein
VRRRALTVLLLAAGLLAAFSAIASAQTPRVLTVGSDDGVAGEYGDLQQAIDAAQPGDWILVGPGDYREPRNQMIPGAMGDDASGSTFLVRTPDLHIRGMDRNTVWLDGTASGPECSSATANQNFGPDGAGRNGIVVYKVSGVTVENLSACNFLEGDNGGGDEIWWDGGGSTGTQTDMSFTGSYLTATSTYFAGENAPSMGYGIYSSNTADGPGLFRDDYASNANDSGFYVGACPDCSVTLDHVQAENNPLGYSGTNSGGNIVIENSSFDENKDGFDTNSQNNDDAPSPQNGSCPNDGVNPSAPAGVQNTHSCWVFMHNDVYDNNNPNVPQQGAAAYGPTGTGMSISGGRNDVVVDNTFADNGAWGILLVPYPDTETPPAIAHCGGGFGSTLGDLSVCYFDDYGNEIADNTFTHDGYYENPSNGDIAEISGLTPDSSSDGNCFHANVDTGGALTSDPTDIDSFDHCGDDYNGETLASELGLQALCDTAILLACPNTVLASYPPTTNVVLKPPAPQPTMPDPCSGVPANPFCPTSTPTAACTTQRALRYRLPRYRDARITEVTVVVSGRVVSRRRGRSLRAQSVSLRGRPAGAVTVTLRLRVRRAHAVRVVVLRHRLHLCAK